MPADHADKPREIGQERFLDCLGWARSENCGECYICKLRNVFAGVWRVLRDDGTLWINQGDSYTSGGRATFRSGVSENKNHDVQNDMPRPDTPQGLKPKDLCAQPWRLALALQADGWYWRDEIIWHKKSCMPSSQRDRCTRSHEVVLMFSKAERYYYDIEAIKEPATCDRMRGSGPMVNVGTGRNDAATGTVGDYRKRRTKGKNSTLDPQAAGYWIVENVANARAEGKDHDSPFGDMRTKRSVWSLGSEPFKESHFATFPSKLIEPMILAGTSAKGVCSSCGAPWVRETETTYKHHEKWFGDKQGARHSRGTAGTSYDEPVGTTTTGWLASCKCEAGEPVPATILDCFGGAGTSGLVADRLGRDAILIELNATYADMARARVTADGPLFAEVE